MDAVYHVTKSLLLLLVCFRCLCAAAECSREDSRLVRNFITTEIVPLYEELGVSMPASCPWNLNKDHFGVQEEHKFAESSSRWVCEFCGKAFHEERFLDMHFANRHPQSVRQGPETHCLTHECPVLRCDVMRRRYRPEYWQRALCKERELEMRRERCLATLAQCVPTTAASANQSASQLYKQLAERTCDLLTCDTYWQLLQDERDPLTPSLYIMASVVIVGFLFIYYTLAYSHFYSDDSIFDPQRMRDPRISSRPFFIPGGLPVRSRHAHR